MSPPVLSTGALTPAGVSPVISPGRLACGHIPCNGFDMSCRRTFQCSLRYTHLYFYILDEVLGPFSMGIGAFLPFYATYDLNGHNIIASMLAADGVRFRMRENAFISVSDPGALQAAIDRIDP